MSKIVKAGVSYYTTGTIVMPAHFPEDKIFCQWCTFVYNQGELKRCRCKLTEELLPYPFDSRGNLCPIQFDFEKEQEEKKEWD